jgi:hypothetical protein
MPPGARIEREQSEQRRIYRYLSFSYRAMIKKADGGEVWCCRYDKTADRPLPLVTRSEMSDVSELMGSSQSVSAVGSNDRAQTNEQTTDKQPTKVSRPCLVLDLGMCCECGQNRLSSGNRRPWAPAITHQRQKKQTARYEHFHKLLHSLLIQIYSVRSRIASGCALSNNKVDADPFNSFLHGLFCSFALSPSSV